LNLVTAIDRAASPHDLINTLIDWDKNLFFSLVYLTPNDNDARISVPLVLSENMNKLAIGYWRRNQWECNIGAKIRHQVKSFLFFFLPITVMEGLSLPSSVNMEGISSLAKGLLGLGSLGVPSTRVQYPIVLCQPMME
jgi:hypothetical protein